MSQRGTPRWVGLHVIWWGGDDWQFTNCVACHEPLRSAISVRNGYGPGCAKQSGLASLVKKTLAEEGARARGAITAKQPVQPHNHKTRKRAQRSKRAGHAPTKKPTASQLEHIKDLALRTKHAYVTPRTRRDATVQIELLRRRLK